jgi:hypothetical protein
MALLTRSLWWFIPAYMLGAAVYELTLVIGGRKEDVSGLVLAALVAMLVGTGLAVLSPRADVPVGVVAALAPSAAAFSLARFYTYDSYFTTLRRYCDNGAVQPAWMFVVTAAAIVAGVLVWRSPRVGAVATAVVLVALAGTNVVMSSH